MFGENAEPQIPGPHKPDLKISLHNAIIMCVSTHVGTGTEVNSASAHAAAEEE